MSDFNKSVSCLNHFKPLFTVELRCAVLVCHGTKVASPRSTLRDDVRRLVDLLWYSGMLRIRTITL